MTFLNTLMRRIEAAPFFMISIINYNSLNDQEKFLTYVLY
jgi:hypothetical protein